MKVKIGSSTCWFTKMRSLQQLNKNIISMEVLVLGDLQICQDIDNLGMVVFM
jgi:hypothetical protein